MKRAMRARRRIFRQSSAAFSVLLLLCSVLTAQTFKPLHNLGSIANEPLNPSPIGLFSQGRDGAIYSTTPYGGLHKSGAAFNISTSGTVTTLFDFNPYSAPRAEKSSCLAMQFRSGMVERHSTSAATMSVLLQNAS